MAWPIFSNGKILFRNGKLAMSTDCCCGSGSGSGSSGSDLQTCCEELGVWPDDYPLTLFVTFSNACCDGANQTVPVDRADPSPFPTYTGVVANCEGGTKNLNIQCQDGAPQWYLIVSGSDGFNNIEAVPLRLLSCSPFHALKEDIPLDSNPLGGWCDGSVDAEVTE
jgi:hypothetical protein